ncbi:MAG: site-specific tyrosine recombinase XerD [Actinobacteria bacterium]|nr:site-specific tyrosine recombinase XerD [Actinomycetota bacterium]
MENNIFDNKNKNIKNTQSNQNSKNIEDDKFSEIDLKIKNFFDFLRFEKHLSINTLDSYKRDILIFKQFLQQKNIKNFMHLSHEEILIFLEDLFKNYSEASISRLLSSIRTFYKYLLRENIYIKNPFIEIKNPKRPRNLIEILNESEVKNFLEKLPSSNKLELRDKAMFELLYSSGLRVSELINLKLSDIDYEEKLIRCIGKGNKERIIPVSDTSMHFLIAYIKTARFKIQSKKSLKSNEFVFLNKNGSKLTRQGFWKILKKYEKKFNLNKNIYPHLFRHSYATHMLERGADLRVVQELLGHSSISTTEIYTNINKKFIKDTYFKYHPENKDNNENK